MYSAILQITKASFICLAQQLEAPEPQGNRIKCCNLNQPSYSKFWQLTWTSKIVRVPVLKKPQHRLRPVRYYFINTCDLQRIAENFVVLQGLHRPNLTGKHASWQRVCFEKPQHHMRPVRDHIINTKFFHSAYSCMKRPQSMGRSMI